MKAAGTWGRGGTFSLSCYLFGHKFNPVYSQEILQVQGIYNKSYLGKYRMYKNKCSKCGYWERVGIEKLEV